MVNTAIPIGNGCIIGNPSEYQATGLANIQITINVLI